MFLCSDSPQCENPLKFIIPDWDDVVDPGFDFVAERTSEDYRRDRFLYGARLWELVGEVVDGVLISISTLSESKLERIKRTGGVRKFMKLPDSMQVIGDCGAWQYRDKEVPPYDVREVLEYYKLLGVDYGVTLDHIPFFGDPVRRMEFTKRAAKEMYELWRSGGYRFELLGAVQGVSIEDYVKSLRELHGYGFRGFAIGGLAKRDTDFVKKLVETVTAEVKSLGGVKKVHFLGVTRLGVLPALRKLADYVDEVSFDSSSILRIAWSREHGNYLTADGRAYTAIRVVDKGPEVEKVAHLLLTKLREYDAGSASFEDVWNVLRDYVRLVGHERYLPYYVATLRDMPWKRCNCGVCKSVGIEVIIFRGNDRNRRRGFHNVYVFSQLLKAGVEVKFVVPRDKNVSVEPQEGDGKLEALIRQARTVLIVTHCTEEKKVPWEKVLVALKERGLPVPSHDLENERVYREALRDFVKPAGEMYGGSFTAVKNLAEALRRAGKEVDVYILSARYGLIREDEPIVPYEATLKGKPKEWIRQWSARLGVENKLFKALSKKYDLIIVVLPKEYAHAVESVLHRLLNMENAVLILPKRVITANGVKARYILAGNLKSRVRQVALLREAVTRMYGTLESFLEDSVNR